MQTQTNRNLKDLRRQFKSRPTMENVARHAKISRPHLANIIAGRRKANPELVQKIEEGFRRYLK